MDVITKNDTEEELKTLTNDLHRVQRMANIGIWQLDIVHNKLSWSDHTYDIFGIDKKNHPIVSINDFFDLIFPDDLEAVGKAYNDHLETQVPYVIRHRILTPDNVLKYVEERCETIFDENGNALLSNGTIQDITEKTLTEKQLQRQKETLLKQSRLTQMGEMINMIAHQWRQPLTSLGAITGVLILDTMMDDYKKDAFLDKLHALNDTINHLSATINDFGDYYKPYHDSEYTTTNLIVKNALSMIYGTLDNVNIEIINNNTNEKVEVYSSELIQVLLNILTNAQDNFIHKKIKNPQIKITTTDKSISICDNGGGVSKDVIEKIFDPYFSTKEVKNEIGLGLYMSKMIIEEHHKGKLMVENIDNGACFTIELQATLKRG